MAAAKGGWKPWEPLDKTKIRSDAGLCGDPISEPAPRAHEKGGAFGPPKAMPYSAVYKSGQTVQFEVDVTTNHNGFFEFFICDVDRCDDDISEDCFKRNQCRQLMRTKVAACESQNSKECGPIDPDYPGRWIVPCRKGGHVGEHFMGGVHMQYKLPSGFRCKHCVIQWYWATANSCNPPGFKEYFDKFPMESWGKCPGDGGAFGARNPGLSQCGGTTFPEEFWSCADVRVTGVGVPPPPKMPPRVELKKAIPENALRSEGDRTPVIMTVERSPAPKPSRKARAKTGASGSRTAKDRGAAKPTGAGSKCVGNYQQCGGVRFRGGTTCCSKSFKCIALNRHYAQCKPRTS